MIDFDGHSTRVRETIFEIEALLMTMIEALDINPSVLTDEQHDSCEGHGQQMAALVTKLESGCGVPPTSSANMVTEGWQELPAFLRVIADAYPRWWGDEIGSEALLPFQTCFLSMTAYFRSEAT